MSITFKNISKIYNGKVIFEKISGRIIEVESMDGNGSNFIIKLPVKTVSNDVHFNENRFVESKIERISIEFSDVYMLGL